MIRPIAALLLSLAVYAADPALSQAPAQRMLAERIGRAYAALALDPGNQDARRQLGDAIQRFERQLAELRLASKTQPALDENYALLDQLWQDYKRLVSASPSRDGAAKLSELSEEVAWIAQKGAQLAEQGGSGASRAVQLAEDAATLSQRLAKIYLLQALGVNKGFLPKDLAAARTEFEQISKQLKSLPGLSQRLKDQIALMDSQWFFFQQAIDELAKNHSDRQLQRNVQTTSERIHEVATGLAASFARTAAP
ncbi:type IV pili methyl-accepting chemotaxis transducer N-terminal domain-containing protein [Chitinimonas lacunae]|uniref:Type IV pili methyl-accepting chemotaxis transducer N-terminal domain-containing protein n=1 Tax=Chitinimonas lacunae TaxID=1963018 RepID=A0ABV8MLT9_9NEIS